VKVTIGFCELAGSENFRLSTLTFTGGGVSICDDAMTGAVSNAGWSCAAWLGLVVGSKLSSLSNDFSAAGLDTSDLESILKNYFWP
jgi:hypothetical protein